MKTLIVYLLITAAALVGCRKPKSRQVSGTVVKSQIVTEAGDLISGTQTSTYLLIVFKHDNGHHKTYQTYSWTTNDVLSKIHECNKRVVLTVQLSNLVHGARCKHYLPNPAKDGEE
jgi:hypothetical protein